MPHLVEAWIESIDVSRVPEESRAALLEAYRVFGEVLVDRVASEVEGSSPEASVDDTFDRALARVARQTRKSRLAMWETLSHVNALLPRVLAELRDDEGRPDEDPARICTVVGTASVALTRVLEAAEIRIQRERSDTVSRMTEILVHELQNRVGAADTASRMLLNPPRPVDTEWLSRISRLITGSLEDSLRTVEDVRHVMVTKASLGEPQMRPILLTTLVRDIVRDFEPRAVAEGVRVKIPDRLPEVLVDASRVRLILANLVGNAIKYSDAEKPEPRVWITASTDDAGRITVTVRDNGIGIEEDDLDEIFLYRFRGHQARTIDGTGLGLAIANEAAEQLGASIDVESRVGAGTSFSVTLRPLPRADDEPTA
jgi:signal transduction histidine kinase